MYYDNMYGSFNFQACSFAYILLLAFVFFSRKKLNTIENKVYSILILLNLFGVAVDIASIYYAFFDPENILLIVLAKIYLTYLVNYMITVTLYFIIIAYAGGSTEKKQKFYTKAGKWFFVTAIICSIIIYCLPLKFNIEGGRMYSYGPGPMATYAISSVFVFSWIVLAIIRRKIIPKGKFFPMISVTIIGSSAAVIQFFIPELLIISAAEVLCVFVLYLTVFLVENPDVRLVEEIKEARNEAERANKSKTEFLSNMSHEIRTPLNAILGFSQGLLEENLKGEAKEDAEDIVNASDSLLSIVNEILDISKIESNKLEIEESEYSFDKIYRYLVTMTQGRLGNKQLEFKHECAENIPAVLYGDSVRIKQIAVNLLTNSVKYTQTGYLKLTIGCDILDSEKCRITITVEDSGIGIKKEDLDKLFSKYERFDSEKNINVEGTGLGLALTKTLVELMNGTINVESKYGEGSKFVVSFEQKIIKLEKEQETTENPINNNIGFIGNKQRVLIVDDNTVNLKVAKRILDPYNLVVEFSGSGKDFIKKYTSGEHYDLVMLDDMMPEMSGIDTLKYLKEHTDYNIPTIALTANALAGMREQYFNDGFDDYLSKPIDKLLLEEILNKYLKNTPDDTNSTEVVESQPEVKEQVQEELEEEIELI